MHSVFNIMPIKKMHGNARVSINTTPSIFAKINNISYLYLYLYDIYFSKINKILFPCGIHIFFNKNSMSMYKKAYLNELIEIWDRLK